MQRTDSESIGILCQLTEQMLCKLSHIVPYPLRSLWFYGAGNGPGMLATQVQTHGVSQSPEKHLIPELSLRKKVLLDGCNLLGRLEQETVHRIPAVALASHTDQHIPAMPAFYSPPCLRDFRNTWLILQDNILSVMLCRDSPFSSRYVCTRASAASWSGVGACRHPVRSGYRVFRSLQTSWVMN